MGTSKYKVSKHESASVVTKVGPSPYGSHASMIDAEESKLVGDEFVVLKDEVGLYLTEKNRLDNRLADPYRCASKEWREKTLKEAKK